MYFNSIGCANTNQTLPMAFAQIDGLPRWRHREGGKVVNGRVVANSRVDRLFSVPDAHITVGTVRAQERFRHPAQTVHDIVVAAVVVND